jgi:hypothetical protein
MAVTGLLVNARANRLRYLLTQDGDAGTTLTITTTGAATPDTLTDSIAGKIRQITKAFTDGYGAFAAGALVQAQSRALWLSDRTTSPGSTEVIMTARLEITPRTGTTEPGWMTDANVDGSGHPTILITAQAAAGTAYLDIELEGGALGA